MTSERPMSPLHGSLQSSQAQATQAAMMTMPRLYGELQNNVYAVLPGEDANIAC